MKIAINGFGRIGRLVARAAIASGDFDVVAINDPSPPETLAHLLAYDSVHGVWGHDVAIKNGNLIVGDREIQLSNGRNPGDLPWSGHNLDMVFECSGFFASKTKASPLLAYAPHVLISAPAGEADATIVYGVNHESLSKSMQVVSNASCTTNCLAPIAAPLHRHLTIKSGLMTTVHAYTNDQSLCDSSHSDLRRARAAGMSMIPTKTGAAAAIGLVIPDLVGKLDGLAVRVPTPNVSLVDVTFDVETKTNAEEVNAILARASQNELAGVLAINELPLVSCDFNHNPNSSIVDAAQTKVINSTLVKVLAWYDNEWGFANRMLDTALFWHKAI